MKASIVALADSLWQNPCARKEYAPLPYCDSTLSFDARAADAVSRALRPPDTVQMPDRSIEWRGIEWGIWGFLCRIFMIFMPFNSPSKGLENGIKIMKIIINTISLGAVGGIKSIASSNSSFDALSFDRPFGHLNTLKKKKKKLVLWGLPDVRWR